jgi:hypothetical protein
MDKRASPLGNKELESTTYMLPLASETSFSELYGFNHCERQLSLVRLVVPFGVKYKLEIRIY